MKSGCFVSNGKRSVELECGWYKGWLVENVYGWQYHGPVEKWPIGGPYHHLIVLRYEPEVGERLAIEERFKDTKAPDGHDGMQYPSL